MRRTYTIYKIDCLPSGKSYIGITRLTAPTRWKYHVKLALDGGGWALAGAIRKYGPDQFIVRAICVVRDGIEACHYERELISTYRTQYPLGYNLTSGGDELPGFKRPTKSTEQKAFWILCRTLGVPHPTENLGGVPKGFKHSEATKAKISASGKGKPHLSRRGVTMPDDIKAKISATLKGRTSPNKGRIASAESREKMRIAQTGRRHPPEVIAKLIAAHSRRKALQCKSQLQS